VSECKLKVEQKSTHQVMATVALEHAVMLAGHALHVLVAARATVMSTVPSKATAVMDALGSRY